MATKREQEMRDLLAEQEASGLSVREFADRRGLKKYSLYWWRSELRRRDRRAAEDHSSSFVEVDHNTHDESGLEVVVTDSDVRIAVDADFDEHVLIRLVSALQKC